MTGDEKALAYGGLACYVASLGLTALAAWRASANRQRARSMRESPRTDRRSTP